MKAIWNGQIIAEAENILNIEGNKYFPPESLKKEFFTSSDFHTTCPWKGEASYYNIIVDGQTNENAAWFYPRPKEGSIPVVGDWNNGQGDFTNWVGFWNGVEVVE